VLSQRRTDSGVVVKDSVVHRPLVRSRSCRQLAQETIGDKGGSKRELLSPAQMEKLGDEGKSFVRRWLSFKPEAGKRVVVLT